MRYFVVLLLVDWGYVFFNIEGEYKGDDKIWDGNVDGEIGEDEVRVFILLGGIVMFEVVLEELCEVDIECSIGEIVVVCLL